MSRGKPKQDWSRISRKFKRNMEGLAIGMGPMREAMQEAMRAFSRDMKEASRKIDWEKSNDIMDRFRAARDNPDHPNAPPWLHIGELTLRQIATFYKRLLDPRAERGRPVGSGPVITDDEAIAAMRELVTEQNLKETTAAKRVLKSRGIKGELKGRAGHLVEVYRARYGRK